MDSLLAAVEVSLVTTTWKGDVVIIAGGVFLGNLAWGALSGFLKWWFADVGKRSEPPPVQPHQAPTPPTT